MSYREAMRWTSSSAASALAWAALGCGPISGDGGETGVDATTVDATTVDATTGSATTASGTESGGPGTVGPDSSGDGGACASPPVDEAIVEQLFISAGPSDRVRVGEATDLRLVWIDAGYPTEVEACVDWSVDAIDGVTIDADGVLTVDAMVPAGTIITVTADLEDGRRILTTELTVYVPLKSPLLGFWTEVQQLPCDGGAAFTPEPILYELVFRDTGEFTVTWTPFESYIDYAGTFTHDPDSGALVLTIDGGNYVPSDIDGEGTATIVDGQLVLTDMWLGTAQQPVTPPACGHVFE
jgi:hypothetical protein